MTIQAAATPPCPPPSRQQPTFGPATIESLKSAGWIVGSPVYAYGLSFGGAMAASLARSDGLAGLIMDERAADYQPVGGDFVPGLAHPFVRVRLDPSFNAFDSQGYALAARAPVLLLPGTTGRVVRPARMQEFAQALEAGGTRAPFAPLLEGHGGALDSAVGRAALSALIAQPDVAATRRDGRRASIRSQQLGKLIGNSGMACCVRMPRRALGHSVSGKEAVAPRC